MQDVAGDGAIVGFDGIVVGSIAGIIVGTDGACCVGNATRTVKTKYPWQEQVFDKFWNGYATTISQEFSGQSVYSNTPLLGSVLGPL